MPAHDDNVARRDFIGVFELRLQAASAQILLRAHAQIAQLLAQKIRGLLGFRAQVGDIHIAQRGLGQGDALVFQFHDDALGADAKASRRGGWAAQLLHQPIIASAAAQGQPLAAAGNHHLEHGLGVVIQAAHDVRIHLEGNAARGQQGLQGFKVLAALVAEHIQHAGRVLDQRLAALLLAVQHAQGIAVKALAAGGAQLIQPAG